MSIDYARKSYESVDDWIARIRAEQSGAPMTDAADRALFSARQAATEAAVAQTAGASSGHGIQLNKPKDQLLVEAIQAEFRRNPELAEAWKNAPGKMTSN